MPFVARAPALKARFICLVRRGGCGNCFSHPISHCLESEPIVLMEPRGPFGNSSNSRAEVHRLGNSAASCTMIASEKQKCRIYGDECVWNMKTMFRDIVKYSTRRNHTISVIDKRKM